MGDAATYVTLRAARIDTTLFTCHDDPGVLSCALPDRIGTEGAGGGDDGGIAGQMSPNESHAETQRPQGISKAHVSRRGDKSIGNQTCI
jgi:hypothetical protein